MNDYSIKQAKNNLFQVGGRPESTPWTRTRDTGLVASYKVRPTISVFDKPKAQLTMNSCKVYKYINLDFG